MKRLQRVAMLLVATLLLVAAPSAAWANSGPSNDAILAGDGHGDFIGWEGRTIDDYRVYWVPSGTYQRSGSELFVPFHKLVAAPDGTVSLKETEIRVYRVVPGTQNTAGETWVPKEQYWDEPAGQTRISRVDQVTHYMPDGQKRTSWVHVRTRHTTTERRDDPIGSEQVWQSAVPTPGSIDHWWQVVYVPPTDVGNGLVIDVVCAQGSCEMRRWLNGEHIASVMLDGQPEVNAPNVTQIIPVPQGDGSSGRLETRTTAGGSLYVFYYGSAGQLRGVVSATGEGEYTYYDEYDQCPNGH